MARARFRFHGALRSFLARNRRDTDFEYSCARAASLKNAVEALGVPHTEIGLVTVNGEPATLQRTVREGDRVEVMPLERDDAEPLVFLADAHLGGLARFLRMLGFDTLHDHALADDEMCRLSATQRRIVLTRDRELLKCRDIARGCHIRALKPDAQLAEAARRYPLQQRARPFTLCLHCNVQLAPIAKAAVAARLPPGVLASQERFTHCAACDRVYWPGSHYERMVRQLSGLA